MSFTPLPPTICRPIIDLSLYLNDLDIGPLNQTLGQDMFENTVNPGKSQGQHYELMGAEDLQNSRSLILPSVRAMGIQCDTDIQQEGGQAILGKRRCRECPSFWCISSLSL
jgi:hypothetical protein